MLQYFLGQSPATASVSPLVMTMTMPAVLTSGTGTASVSPLVMTMSFPAVDPTVTQLKGTWCVAATQIYISGGEAHQVFVAGGIAHQVDC